MDQDGRKKSLKHLTYEFLNTKIQEGEHSSAIDSQASIGLYRLFENEWEKRGADLIQREYIGTGTIKRVMLKANDPMLTIMLQIDIMDPDNERKD